jgi:hypothetical protein
VRRCCCCAPVAWRTLVNDRHFRQGPSRHWCTPLGIRGRRSGTTLCQDIIPHRPSATWASFPGASRAWPTWLAKTALTVREAIRFVPSGPAASKARPPESILVGRAQRIPVQLLPRDWAENEGGPPAVPCCRSVLARPAPRAAAGFWCAVSQVVGGLGPRWPQEDRCGAEWLCGGPNTVVGTPPRIHRAPARQS